MDDSDDSCLRPRPSLERLSGLGSAAQPQMIRGPAAQRAALAWPVVGASLGYVPRQAACGSDHALSVQEAIAAFGCVVLPVRQLARAWTPKASKGSRRHR